MLVAVDLGGTKTRTSLVDKDRIIRQITFLTEPEKGKSFILKELFKSIDYVSESKKINAILIAVAGITDGKIVLEATNLALKNFKLASIIERKYNKPCFLENDANSFAYAEFVNLRKKDNSLKNLVGITLGTGVGAGIIINGEVYRGLNNSAGEAGHMTVNSQHKKCKCGNFDCLELYASSNFIEKEYLKAGHHKLTAEEVSMLYKTDKAAKKAISDFAKNVAVGVVNLANILAPQVISIGGGLSNIDYIFKPISEYFKKHAFPTIKDNVKVLKSSLGRNAVALGLSYLYYDSFSKKNKN